MGGNLSAGMPADKPKSEPKKQAGFMKHIVWAAVLLLVVAFLPAETFILSFVLGGIVVGLLLNLIKQYKTAFAAPSGGFELSADLVYRTGQPVQAVPAQGLQDTPDQVHDGSWTRTRLDRQQTLDECYRAHPERHRKRPTAPAPPETAWINPNNPSVTGSLIYAVRLRFSRESDEFPLATPKLSCEVGSRPLCGPPTTRLEASIARPVVQRVPSRQLKLGLRGRPLRGQEVLHIELGNLGLSQQ